MTRAVVFAYHDVGVRCLRTLLAHGVDVRLVVTHMDAPGEEIWFDSVARHARWHRLPIIAPDDPNDAATLARIRAADPDFLFSFYYRRMLGAELLEIPARGGWNMHGSLLPHYRGRAPVNWAVLRGEERTGATLHAMTAKPDAGAIVDQQPVPILPDDTAVEVMRKVTVAAELVLMRSLPDLISGQATLRSQDLQAGSYFGGRRREDGRIDWASGVAAVHNLVRAVAPPYPGAFCTLAGETLRVLRTLPASAPRAMQPVLQWIDNEVWALCRDGALRLLQFQLGATTCTAEDFHRRFGSNPIPLDAG